MPAQRIRDETVFKDMPDERNRIKCKPCSNETGRLITIHIKSRVKHLGSDQHKSAVAWMETLRGKQRAPVDLDEQPDLRTGGVPQHENSEDTGHLTIESFMRVLRSNQPWMEGIEPQTFHGEDIGDDFFDDQLLTAGKRIANQLDDIRKDLRDLSEGKLLGSVPCYGVDSDDEDILNMEDWDDGMNFKDLLEY
ncbi:hypothetical protein NP233_g7704 [Leucocoprinus birnbaumii]|uniref:Uncharacterized protein n=1 Tax=Leucocoprinus birnbaumii TaxID=56174 RepID=A0AAD5VPH7_9AGAR|nr:hypothetical protein NP233_g7704 [Leucocoprinus birnbaumii]